MLPGWAKCLFVYAIIVTSPNGNAEFRPILPIESHYVSWLYLLSMCSGHHHPLVSNATHIYKYDNYTSLCALVRCTLPLLDGYTLWPIGVKSRPRYWKRLWKNTSRVVHISPELRDDLKCCISSCRFTWNRLPRSTFCSRILNFLKHPCWKVQRPPRFCL